MGTSCIEKFVVEVVLGGKKLEEDGRSLALFGSKKASLNREVDNSEILQESKLNNNEIIKTNKSWVWFKQLFTSPALNFTFNFSGNNQEIKSVRELYSQHKVVKENYFSSFREKLEEGGHLNNIKVKDKPSVHLENILQEVKFDEFKNEEAFGSEKHLWLQLVTEYLSLLIASGDVIAMSVNVGDYLYKRGVFHGLDILLSQKGGFSFEFGDKKSMFIYRTVGNENDETYCQEGVEEFKGGCEKHIVNVGNIYFDEKDNKKKYYNENYHCEDNYVIEEKETLENFIQRCKQMIINDKNISFEDIYRGCNHYDNIEITGKYLRAKLMLSNISPSFPKSLNEPSSFF